MALEQNSSSQAEQAASAPAHVQEPLVQATPAELSLSVKLAMREEAKFLQEKFGITVVDTESRGGDAILVLPKKVQSQSEIDQYLAENLGGLKYFYRGTTPEGAQQIKVNTFLLRHTVKTLQWPIGRRAQPDVSDDLRMEMENDFRMMLGVPLRSKLAEGEDLLHKSYADALAAIELQSQIGFEKYIKHGIYHLPIAEKNSAAERIVATAHAHGLLNADEAKFTTIGDDQLQLELTPKALSKLVGWVAHGLVTEKGETLVPGASAPEHVGARESYLRSLRKTTAFEGMNRFIEASISPELLQRARAESGIAEREEKVPLGRALTAKYNSALQAALVESTRDVKHAVEYDPTTMRDALARAQRMLDEPRYWDALETAQAVSHHNQIRDLMRQDVADLQTIFASPNLSQQGMSWVVNESAYGETLRTLGHLMGVIGTTRNQETANQKNSPEKQDADSFAKAFNFSALAMTPKGSEAKQASYYLRNQLGLTSFGEKVKRNAFAGIQPIIHSIEPAKEKPLLAAGAVVGLALWSAYAPRELSPYALLVKWGHDLMERFEKQGAHPVSEEDKKAVKEAKKQISNLQKQLEKLRDEKGSDFKSGMNTGYFSGMSTAALGFIAFSVIEDIIVHVPLALVSVTVGFMGKAGSNVLKSMFADMGDIAYKFTPDAAKSIESDAKSVAKLWSSTSPLKQFGDGLTAIYHDVDDLGLVATTRHNLHKVTHAFSRVGEKVQQAEKVQAQGRAMA